MQVLQRVAHDGDAVTDTSRFLQFVEFGQGRGIPTDKRHGRRGSGWNGEMRAAYLIRYSRTSLQRD